MWIKEFNNLSELNEFLVKQINYNEEKGFSFVEINTKLLLHEVIDTLGKPDSINTESNQQQTLLYSSWIDHPTEGKRDHHKLNALFWSFEMEQLEVIRVHIDYYKTGDLATPFHQFIKGLFNSLIEKLGKPEKKSMREGNEEMVYNRGKHKFLMWSNSEGLRIQIK